MARTQHGKKSRVPTRKSRVVSREPAGITVPYGRQGLLVRFGLRKPRTALLVREDELIGVLDRFVRRGRP